MLFYSFFKSMVGKEVVVELRNSQSITGTLHSVDQYLNIKLVDIEVAELEKYPHMLGVTNSFIRGSVVRYLHLHLLHLHLLHLHLRPLHLHLHQVRAPAWEGGGHGAAPGHLQEGGCHQQDLSPPGGAPPPSLEGGSGTFWDSSEFS